MFNKLTNKALQVIGFVQGGAGFDKFTNQAVEVIRFAQVEARSLEHNFVGTEQILLGLIAEDRGIAAKVLKSAQVKLDDARREVEKIIGRGSNSVQMTIPFTPRVKRVFEFSLEEADRLKSNYISTEHLLLGLLREGGGVGVRVLKVLGVDTKNLREQVLEEITSGEVTVPAIISSRSQNIVNPQEELIPIDFTSGAISARFCSLLSDWVDSHDLGYVVSANTGFHLSNGDIVAPHISYYSCDRLKEVPRIYPESLPNLVVEIKSAFDRLIPIQNKIFKFLELGISTAILINPDDRMVIVYIHEPDQKHIVNTFTEGDKLSLPELLPGWEIDVTQLWISVV